MNCHAYARPWTMQNYIEYGATWNGIMHRMEWLHSISSCGQSSDVKKNKIHLSWICDRKMQPIMIIIMFVVGAATLVPYHFSRALHWQLYTMLGCYDGHSCARQMHSACMILHEVQSQCGRGFNSSARERIRKSSNRTVFVWNANGSLNRDDIRARSKIQCDAVARCIQFPFHCCVALLRHISLSSWRRFSFWFVLHVFEMLEKSKLHASLDRCVLLQWIYNKLLLLICCNCNMDEDSTVRSSLPLFKFIEFNFLLLRPSIVRTTNSCFVEISYIRKQSKSGIKRKGVFRSSGRVDTHNKIRNGF